MLAFCAKLEISFRGFQNDPTNVSVSLLLLVSTNECMTKGSLGVKVCYYIGFKYQILSIWVWFAPCSGSGHVAGFQNVVFLVLIAKL